MLARAPGASRTASEDKRSATSSRSCGSPMVTSRSPGSTGRSLMVTTDSTTPSAGALMRIQQLSGTSVPASGRISAASARARVLCDMSTRAPAASSPAMATASRWVASSSRVSEATLRSASAFTRSNWLCARMRSSMAFCRSARATCSAACASCKVACACARVRASSRCGRAGSTMATRVSPAVTRSPARTGERRAVPAIGAATSNRSRTRVSPSASIVISILPRVTSCRSTATGSSRSAT